MSEHNFYKLKVRCACGRARKLSPEWMAQAYQTLRGKTETPATADEPCEGCGSSSVVLVEG